MTGTHWIPQHESDFTALPVQRGTCRQRRGGWERPRRGAERRPSCRATHRHAARTGERPRAGGACGAGLCRRQDAASPRGPVPSSAAAPGELLLVTSACGEVPGRRGTGTVRREGQASPRGHRPRALGTGAACPEPAQQQRAQERQPGTPGGCWA